MFPFGFPPTRQSRYLARENFHLVKEYRTLNSETTEREVLAAIRIVDGEAGGNTKLMAAALYVALLVVCGLAVYVVIGM